MNILKLFLILSSVSLCTPMQIKASESYDFSIDQHSTFNTDREDGRYLSSRAITHRMMYRHQPRLAFDSTINATRFADWRRELARTMAQLMKHPNTDLEEQPQLLSVHQRDGYRIERWEIYPFNESAVRFLALIPDNINTKNPSPALMCIPGFGQTKELLCGETDIDLSKSITSPEKNAQAYQYVKEGWIAIAVDNPGCGESADLEYLVGRRGPDYVTLSRSLLEMGWSYLGYSSFIDRLILEWMKKRTDVRKDRIVVSGFSLGTEPLMVLGALDQDIFAFVYNDFLCTTRERALVMTQPDTDGCRPWPNDISHLIPGFLCEFDFPDIVASLAPRPLICTEGGLDRDFELVKRAYSIFDATEMFESHHYERYNDPSSRQKITQMPEGIDRATFFNLANVDPPHHYFKSEHILPWLRNILK